MAQNCSRRLFLLGTATTVAGAFLAACGEEPPLEVAKAEVPVGSAIIADGYIIAQPEEEVCRILPTMPTPAEPDHQSRRR